MIQRLLNILNVDTERLLKGENRILLQGSASALVLKSAGLLLGYILTLIIAGKSGAEVLGNFVLSAILLDIISIVVSMGVENGMLTLVSRYDAAGEDELIRNTVVRSYMLVLPAGLILTPAVYYSADLLVPLISDSSQLAYFIRVMIFGILPLTLLKVNSQYMRARKRIIMFGLFNYVLVYLSVIILLTFAWLTASGRWNDPVIAGLTFNKFVPYAFTAGCSVMFLISVFFLLKDLPRRTKADMLKKKKVPFRLLLSLSVPVMYSEVLMFVKTWTASILTGFYTGEVNVGIFNIVLKLSSVSSIIVIAVSAISMPLFSAMHAEGDYKSMQKLAGRSARLIYITAFPVIAAIILSAPFVLGIIGPEFTAGFIPLILLCAGQGAEILSGSGAYILQVTGRQKVYRNLVIFNTVISVILFIVMIPLWGITGAAAAMLCGSIVWSVSLIWYIKSKMGIRVYRPLRQYLNRQA